MAKNAFEIWIDMEKKCKGCGEAGAVAEGYCLACVAKGIKEGKYDHIIKPIKDAVKNARRPTMAKKDSMQTQVEKTETEENQDVVGTFPKITSHCQIKQCLLKKGGKDIRFDNFKVSEGQTELLDSLIQTGEEVAVTISPTQGRLPGC